MKALMFFSSVVVWLVSFPTQAATLTGKIVVTDALREELNDVEKKNTDGRCYWNEPNGITPVVPPNVDPSTDIAVVVNREGAEKPKADPLATVMVRAADMERKVVVTRPGSTIRFRNEGPFDHELYSIGLESFRPERQSSDAYRPVEFEKEGVYEIRCKLMSHFKAYVVVTAATSILQVAQDGTFSMSDIVPGKYTLSVFYEGEWVKHESFEVKDETKRDISMEIELGAKAHSPKSGSQEDKGGKKPDGEAAKP